MKFKVKMPARINILGNPSDANEGAHQTISAAIGLYGEAVCEDADALAFELRGEGGMKSMVVRSDSDLEYGDDFDLFKAGVKILIRHSPEFCHARFGRFPKFIFSSEIPRQSGLGGSTVLLLLAMTGLVRFYGLDRRKHNIYALAELAQRAEEKELGITCGFADRYASLFGDIAYIDYRGKLFHKPLYEEPFATYERFGSFVKEFPLVLVYTGVPHDSGDVHGRMRARYLDELSRWHEGNKAAVDGDYKGAPALVKIMKEIGDTAWKGKMALLEADLERFGALMSENNRLTDEMMRHCGFEGGVGEANKVMIEAAMEAGALGAKLTGAGGGGSVFALARPGGEDKVAESLKKKLEECGYSHGKVYTPKIEKRGAVVEEMQP